MKNKLIMISGVFIFIDQLIKVIVRSSLMGKEITLIPHFLYLSGVKNTGGAFSILSNNTLLLAFIGIIVVGLIIYYLSKKKIANNIELISYSILLGGIIGNFIDRVVFNGVYDYIGMIFGSYYFPIYNFADIGIVIGIILLIILEIKGDYSGNRSR